MGDIDIDSDIGWALPPTQFCQPEIFLWLIRANISMDKQCYRKKKSRLTTPICTPIGPMVWNTSSVLTNISFINTNSIFDMRDDPSNM